MRMRCDINSVGVLASVPSLTNGQRLQAKYKPSCSNAVLSRHAVEAVSQKAGELRPVAVLSTGIANSCLDTGTSH
jgi:hypothetical protein